MDSGLLTRRALLRGLARACVVGICSGLAMDPPAMCMEVELRTGARDADGFITRVPTGRRFWRVNGRSVTEAQFFAVAATHPHPCMREWAAACREQRVRGESV